MTYNEGFSDLIGFATEVMWRMLATGAKWEYDIIIDRTNMSSKARKKYFNLLRPYGYTFEAVVFEIPEKEEWDRRLNSRPGKTIPPDVIQNMVDRFEMPTEAEGFDKITTVLANERHS